MRTVLAAIMNAGPVGVIPLVAAVILALVRQLQSGQSGHTPRRLVTLALWLSVGLSALVVMGQVLRY
jgi:hypothetical protein